MNNKTNVVIKAFIVAVIVASLLLIINQFDALFGQVNIRFIPAILTYSVPFMVFYLVIVTIKKIQKASNIFYVTGFI